MLKKNARQNLSDSAKVRKWEFSIANACDAIPGATGTGKTAFALQMAYQMAAQRKDVLYISLEIYERHISRISYQLYGNTFKAKTVHSIIQEKKAVVTAREHLQILKAHDPHMTDKQAVNYNVLRLKQLSRDFKIPIIALA